MANTCTCPNCNKLLSIAEANWGRPVRCPVCNHVFVGGAAAAVPPPPPVVPPPPPIPPPPDIRAPFRPESRPVVSTGAARDYVAGPPAPLGGGRLASMAETFLIVGLFVEFGRLLVNLFRIQTVSAYGGLTMPMDEASPFQSLIDCSVLFVSVGSVVSVLLWIYVAHRNLDRLGVEGRRFTPGWAVGWFFVPFANLLMPFQAMQELWQASNPDAPLDDPEGWREGPGTTLVFWWWACCLLAIGVGVTLAAITYEHTRHQGFGPGAAFSRRLAIGVEMLASAVNILGTLFLIGIIQQVQKRQTRRLERLRQYIGAEDEENMNGPQSQ